MKQHPEIQINRFQLGVLIDGLEKEFMNCIMNSNIYCSHCKGVAIKGVFVDEIYHTNRNNVRIYGRCKVCNTKVARLFEFSSGEFNKKANRLRMSVKLIELSDPFPSEI